MLKFIIIVILTVCFSQLRSQSHWESIVTETDEFKYISSNLPIIKINTEGKTIVDEPKIMAKMKVIKNGHGLNSFDETNYE